MFRRGDRVLRRGIGQMVAHWAHNPKILGSNPSSTNRRCDSGLSPHSLPPGSLNKDGVRVCKLGDPGLSLEPISLGSPNFQLCLN